jgi:hypothetical protein
VTEDLDHDDVVTVRTVAAFCSDVGRTTDPDVRPAPQSTPVDGASGPWTTSPDGPAEVGHIGEVLSGFASSGPSPGSPFGSSSASSAA